MMKIHNCRQLYLIITQNTFFSKNTMFSRRDHMLAKKTILKIITMMVEVNCQLSAILNHLADKPVDTLLRGLF